MLTLEKRPKTFAQLAGQDQAKKTLLHISRDPYNSPKVLLLAGAYGTGKTTCARILARALNCPNRLPNGDACGRKDCPICGHDIQDSMFYSEYDSAIVGNVDTIREMRDSFYFGYKEGFKVIVLDEIHLVSRSALGALLKVFEEPEPNVFFLLCTTDPDKLLPTILSRSLRIEFNNISTLDIIDYLTNILIEKNVDVTDEIKKNLQLIAERSNGHMRNAIMLLDSMLLLKEDFQSVVMDGTELFNKLCGLSFLPLKFKEKADADINNTIKQLTTIPMANLKQDYYNFVLKLLKQMVTDDQNLPKIYSNFKPRVLELSKIFLDETIASMFNNEIQFQIAMLRLTEMLKKFASVK